MLRTFEKYLEEQGGKMTKSSMNSGMSNRQINLGVGYVVGVISLLA